ncbi:MAG: RluA family pseudouridine synthase [Minisyncoccota bacterium]
MEILYEDLDILAINKPAGLVVHPDGKTIEPSVSEWFVKKYPESKDVGEPIELKNGQKIERPGIVHRIDRETSGVLLLAKTKAGHECLKSQFQNREIDKIYHVFLYGNLKEDHGTISLSIERSRSDFRKKIATTASKGIGREALTYYRVLSRGEGATLVEAKPKTGRTHQIRVHFKALHHPVVTDKLYAPNKEPVLGFSRLALHAKEIVFSDTKGERHTVSAPYPEDFKNALDTL